MPNLLNLSDFQVLIYPLVFLRVLFFCIAWPLFGANCVPKLIKILLAIILAGFVLPLAYIDIKDQISYQQLEGQFLFLAFQQILIGLFIGFSARMFFYGISFAGQLMGWMMGFSAATIFNPTTNSQANVIEQTQVVLMSLFFLALNAHHYLISAIIESFSILPLSMRSLNLQGFKGFASWGHDLIVLALKISAPVVVVLIITNIVVGVVSRALSHFPIGAISAPINILAGLFFMIVTTPFLFFDFNIFWLDMVGKIFDAMKTL